MNLEQFQALLEASPSAALHLMLPDGDTVPAHFHVTEVGRVQKDFVDCGGTMRSHAACVLQVWVADDVDHRLDTSKLAKIVKLAGSRLALGGLPVEIEYGSDRVSQYPIAEAEITPAGLLFQLGSKQTACLAADKCGVSLDVADACCTAPGCC